MIKKTILLLLLVVTAVAVRAQGVLEVDDLSQANAVYSSEGEKAAVEIRCNHTIPLQFSSTMDKSVEPWGGYGDDTTAIPRTGREFNEIHGIRSLNLGTEEVNRLIHR